MDLFTKSRHGIRNTILFALTSLILVSFFLIRAESSFDCFTGEYSSDVAIALENGKTVKQVISEDITDISSLEILFGTYKRANKGVVVVTLYEDQRIIEQWNYDTSTLQDCSYCRFNLEQPFHLSNNHNYCFTIEDRFDGQNQIAVWSSGSVGSIDNVCYRLGYVNQQMKIAVTIAALLIFAITLLLVVLPIDERIIMTWLIATLVVVCFLICPLGMAPDERDHFYRAYEIAHGNLLSRNYGEFGGGNILPSAIADFNDTNAVIDWTDTECFCFPNTALYAPINYMPQAIGIRVAEIFTNKVFFAFLGGRIAETLICLGLSITSIWLIPYGRKIVFLVLLFPMTLQEVISLAPDGIVINLSVFLLSYILYLRYQEGHIRRRDFAILAWICLWLSLCKIVYVVLILLVLLIPKVKFKSKKNQWMLYLGIVFPAVILNLIWLGIASEYLCEIQPGVDASAQVKSILANPLNYYIVVIRSVIDDLDYYIRLMIGSNMGAAIIKITPSVWITYLIVFVTVLVRNNERITGIRKTDKYVLFFVFAACSFLIFTSVYVQWTAAGNDTVLGIQGRYFTPILPVLALGVIYSIREHDGAIAGEHHFDPRSSYLYIILLLLNGITVLDMISYYNYYG